MTKHEYLDAMLNDLTSVANNYDFAVVIGPDTRRPDDKRGPAKADTMTKHEYLDATSNGLFGEFFV